MTHALATAAALVGGAGGAYFAPLLGRFQERRRLLRLCHEQRALVLTYDDGPGVRLTLRLVELLAQYAAPATFFLLGRNVQAHPEVVERLVAAGHELGCHTYNHRHGWRTWPMTIAADVRAGFAALRPWQAHTAQFRPPHGKLTLPGWWVMRRHGARCGYWTHDSGDTRAQLPDVDRIVGAVRQAGGGVVLMHDFERTGQEGTRRAEYVLELTRQLLEWVRSEKLRVCTLSALEGRAAVHAAATYPFPGDSRLS